MSWCFSLRGINCSLRASFRPYFEHQSEPRINPYDVDPVAIVPREHMTPNLAEGRIVLDIGDDRYWLMPRDLSARTLFFTMRHGVSQMDSKKFRVGRRFRNVLDPRAGNS